MFRTPPPSHYAPAIVNHPEYHRVYLHYLEHGTESDQAHELAHLHATAFVAGALQNARAKQQSVTLKVGAISGAAVVAVCAIFGIVGAVSPNSAPDSKAANSTVTNSPSTAASASPSVAAANTSPRPTTDAPTTASAAVQTLNSLPVEGRAALTGFHRDAFGQAWADTDRNGCDTRNDMLARDLDDATIKPGTNNCVILTGALQDPYTGSRIAFQSGAGGDDAVQVNHVVGLADAWQKGAQDWTQETRVQFANDPTNLQTTNGPTSVAKKDGDAATWLPPNKAYRCTYVTRQIAVKFIYGLWITAAEKSAMTTVLAGCIPRSATPDVNPLANPTTPASRPTQPAAQPPASQSPAWQPSEAPDNSGSVYYENCDAVRAAGKAPLYAGEPGYRSKLDRDNDGIACE